MSRGTKEIDLEQHIVDYLTREVGPGTLEYQIKDTKCYDKELCLIPEDLFGFLEDTQEDKLVELYKQYGANTHQKVVERVAEELKKHKTLHVLREKVKDRGQNLDLVYFKPNHNKSPEHAEWYNKNRLTIIRQLKYSRANENSIDIVIFINGIPILTMELKNALTGQYLHHAIKQYMRDRNPKEPLLEFKRCLVHFAVSTEQVSMCTELKGESTFFLPFNKELVNVDENGYAVSYLWEDVLRKDSLMDLVQNYIAVQVNREKSYDANTGQLKEKKKEVLIFPRYHQRRAVSRLLNGVKNDGAGSKYLIQHSAGSGKSNTISWLAHRLSDFYQNEQDDKALFDGVIVVTDRRVLDKQIQDNIKQFDHVPGSVAYIDENKTSEDLKIAIQDGKRIIVTTLQKFPVISEVVAHFKERKYAVIIDEAHSSQSGESARHLRKALSLEDAEKGDGGVKTLDEIIEDEIKKKGDQRNLSYFAFTATPKPKTIELFGTSGEGGKAPFDVYTMEQAIKEGFIKDVLKNYMSWKRYYKLVKRTDIDDKEYEKKKAVRLLSSYVDLQDHAIEKKSRIMIEHFVSQTQREIQGKARAMLVTRSRLHAVRYKRKFDDIMREMKLPYSALVAFSGSVMDGETGIEYTKESLNDLEGKISIPDALKLPQFRILIVANMYQTGFDEPMLHTMFVDKKLGGSSTVQTLSRLNRTMAGKDGTMILDFVNDPEKVKEDFQQYYGSNYMEVDDETDPNSLYDVLGKIEADKIIYQNDLEAFAQYFFTQNDEKEKLQPILNSVVKRYNEELDVERQILFKVNVKSFVRLYRFLSQIITFADMQLEKYYVFLTALHKKLPSSPNALPTSVLEEIDLDSYKVQHQFTTNLELTPGNTGMQGMAPGGGKKDADETEWLTKIIKILNDTFGLDLKEEDKVEVARIKENIYSNEVLMSFFNKMNSKENIQDKFNEEIDSELLNMVSTKIDLYNKLTEDRVNNLFKQAWFNELYDARVRGML